MIMRRACGVLAVLCALAGTVWLGWELRGTDASVMRQYLIPADVTQEDAGTCWVEVRGDGRGHAVCFAPGETSRFRPYVRESVTESGETWTVR